MQLFLIAPASVAHASTTQIKDAALAIYHQCGARTPSKGGVASNIGTHNWQFTSNDLCLTFEAGGDNNLAVVLGATRYPGVLCQAGQAPSRRACNNIVGLMQASPTRRRFGENLVAPDIGLPFVYKSSMFLACPYLLN